MGLIRSCQWLAFLFLAVASVAQTSELSSGPIHISCTNDLLVVVPENACSEFLEIIPPTVQAAEPFTFSNNYTNTDDASGFYDVGTTIVTWTAIDDSGSSTACNQIITVTDNQAPTISCPTNVNLMLENNECGRVLTINPPLVSDNCNTLFLTNDFNGTDNISGYFPAGIININWEVSDGSGNAASCVQEISLLENVPPTISCPPDLIFNTDPGLCEAFVNVPPPAVLDNCPLGLVYSNNLNNQEDASGDFALGTTLITWTTTDASGNTAICTHNVTIIDEEPPAFNCPDTVFAITAPQSCAVFIELETPEATDNCSTTIFYNNDFTNSDNADGNYPVDTTFVTWTATDEHGNQSTCVQIVIVEDQENPQIVCNMNSDQLDALENCEAALPDYLAQVEFSDNCSTISNIILTQTPSAGTFLPKGDTTVIVTATDENGNSNFCSIAISVTDALPPVLSCNALADSVFINAGCQAATPDYASLISMQDECSFSENLTVQQSPAPDSLLHVGLHNIEMTVTDEAGLQSNCFITLLVLDTIPPLVICDAAIDTFYRNLLCPMDVPDYLSEFFFSDNCGDENIALVQDPPPGTSVNLGSHVITIQGTDLSGNFAICEKQILLLDTLPPIINCPQNITVEALHLACDATVELIPATAVDFCSSFSISNNLTGDTPGTVTLDEGVNFIDWTATDDAGNVDICRQTITVITDLDISANIVTNPGCEAGFAVLNAPDFEDALYTWTGPEGFASSEQNPQIDNLTTAMTGTYDVLINHSGCQYFGATNLEVILPPAVVIQGDQIICAGEQLSFELESSLGSAISSYQWATPENEIITTPELVLNNITPAGTGIYSVSTIGEGGCESYADIEVVVFDFPMAEDDIFYYNKEDDIAFNILQNDYFNVDGDYTLKILTTPLQGTLTDEGDGNFRYTPDENFDGNEKIMYEFCYNHCPGFCTMATISIETIIDTENCNIPNLLTPNDDGYNDVLVISCLQGNNFPYNHLTIVNEWGDKVFEAKPYLNNWDGTFDNKSLPDGTYFYFFKKEKDGEYVQGHISLYK